ncbi:MAG: nitroreductase family protein [Chloroflexi bacterium]|nr:nitroreductase family protein [Chloroflexota bacterium]
MVEDWNLTLMGTEPVFVPLPGFREYPEDVMVGHAADFYADMARRRTVRQFSDRPVPRKLIENCLRAASTAPSGANMQPWKFVVVSDPALKKQIRGKAEDEEHEFYTRRATPEWLAALEPLGTDERKPYLETAPYLIAIFVERFGMLPDGRKMKYYYTVESVGIATGMLITAIHHAGLASLTHTPSPMGFLNEILDRPDNERPFLILVVGYPAAEAVVPKIRKKGLDEISIFL